MGIRHFVNIIADIYFAFRLLSGQTRKEKLVSSIKYLEYQVQSLINLNCVTKFRYTVIKLPDYIHLEIPD